MTTGSPVPSLIDLMRYTVADKIEVIAPPGKGRWVKGEFFPTPAATPSPAVPVAPPSPSVADTPSEKRAGGDSLPPPRPLVSLQVGGRGGGFFVSRLRSRCATCGAVPGAFCVRVATDPAVFLLSHRGRA